VTKQPSRHEEIAVNDMAKNIVLWVIIAVVLMTVFNSFTAPKTSAPQISYSKFLEQVDRNNVASVTIYMMDGSTA
jgi:cell division protease FtsH